MRISQISEMSSQIFLTSRANIKIITVVSPDILNIFSKNHKRFFKYHFWSKKPLFIQYKRYRLLTSANHIKSHIFPSAHFSRALPLSSLSPKETGAERDDYLTDHISNNINILPNNTLLQTKINRKKPEC